MTFPLGSSLSPSYLSSSPIRSSPLTAPPHFSPARTPSPSLLKRSVASSPASSSGESRRRSSQPSSALTRPHRLSLTSFTPSTPAPEAANSPPPHPASPPLSRSQPLLGSYQLSLLHSRMSRTQSHSVSSDSTKGFSIRICSVGKGKTCPTELRRPAHLDLPFSATYYELLEAAIERRGGASQTPWVGTVDLERHYFNRYTTNGSFDRAAPPDFPGYQVAPVGQLQIIIKNASNPVKAFVVPYDLRSLPIGGRLLVRERSSSEAEPEGTSVSAKKLLRYALQLQFTCQALRPDIAFGHHRGAETTRRPRHSAPSTSAYLDAEQLDTRQYYVSKSIKVIFTAQPPSSSEQIRTERYDEVVPPSEETLGSHGRIMGFSPGQAGRRQSGDWGIVRQKWLARRSMQEQSSDIGQARTDWRSVGEKGQGAADEEGNMLVSPTATSAPLPIFSPVPRAPIAPPSMATIYSAGPSRVPSRSTTPITEPPTRIPVANAGRVGVSEETGPVKRTSAAPTRKSRRQGSGSAAERELSERLRLMELKNGEGRG